MSSEKRLVRPYTGLDRFQSVLDRWHLRLGEDVFQPGDRLVVTSSSFLNDPATLVCAAGDDDLEDTRQELAAATEAIGLEPTDLELLVLVSTPYLRLADVVARRSLDDPDAVVREVAVPRGVEAARALLTPAGGSDVDVYLCLARAVEPAPLRPSRVGTWLAHVRFSLRTQLGEIGFTPRVLSSEIRAQYGIPDDAIRYVVVDPADLLADDVAAVELYIDEDVLASLNQSPHTAAARFFQRQLYVDVVSSIVRTAAASGEWGQKELTDIDDTIVGTLVDAVAEFVGKGESDAEHTKRREQAIYWFQHEPEAFIAQIEASVTPRDDLRHAIGGFDA